MSYKRNQTINYENNLVYKGSTKNSIPQGKGVLEENNFYTFIGNWKEGKKEGKGKIEVNLNYIFSIGGDIPEDEKHPFSSFYFFTEDLKYHSLPPCKYPRSVGSFVFLDHYLYYIGGFDGNRAISYVEQYDLFTKKWTTLSSLINRRASLKSFIYNSKIYIFGGVMGSVVHNTIEEYNIKENKWKIFAHLKHGRSGASVHIWKDKCYILGGISLNNTSLPLEILDLKTKKSILDENITISSFSSASILVEINNKPYIIISGGKIGKSSDILNKVFSYSIEDNIIKELCYLNIERIYHSLVIYKNELYCMGGHDKNENTLLPYEKYNFKNNEWELKDKINISLSGSSFLSIENQKISLEGKWKNNKLEGNAIISLKDKKIEGKYKEEKKEGFFNDIYYKNDIPISYKEILWENRIKKIKNIPEDFKCPISLEIMIDPVIIDSGITFDKKNIEEWFINQNTCPLTREVIEKKYIPNKILKTMILEFLEKKTRN